MQINTNVFETSQKAIKHAVQVAQTNLNNTTETTIKNINLSLHFICDVENLRSISVSKVPVSLAY